MIPSFVGSLVFVHQCYYGPGTWITLLYAAGMTVWATAVLEGWKRKESRLAHRWGVLDMQELEQERPSFEGTLRYDTVDERYVTTFSRLEQSKRYVVTVPIILLTLLAVGGITFFYFQLESYTNDNITEEFGWTGMWTVVALLPCILYAVVVMVLDALYLTLAVKLNEYENHRTESEFADSLVIKLASFYFINNFGLLFYIAFFLQDFELLQSTLGSLLVIRQVIGNVKETLVPYLMTSRSQKTASNIEKSEMTLKQNGLLAEGSLPVYDGTFDDVLELFVQFGQVTLFAAAYPLAGLCSLANNVLEIRADAFKICTTHRRPMPVQCKGIGTWLKAFECLGYIAVLTNCTLVGWLYASPTTPQSTTLLNIVVAEHILIAIKLIVDAVIPDVPSDVVDLQKAERKALLKKAVQGNMEGEENTLEQERSKRKELEREVLQLSALYKKWVFQETEKKSAETKTKAS